MNSSHDFVLFNTDCIISHNLCVLLFSARCSIRHFISFPPLPRCGSVVLDFMMRFNRSVVFSNVLTVLLDAARQDKFGGFKVDPESIKQVFIPTDGSESTTKGKFYKEILLLNVYAYSSEDGLFLIVFSMCLIKKLSSASHIFPSFVFVAVVILFN